MYSYIMISSSNVSLLCYCSALVHNSVSSFIQAISIAPLQSTASQRRSRHSTDTVSKFHAEAPQASASEGIAHYAQGTYVAVRAGFEPTILRTKALNLPMSHHATQVTALSRDPSVSSRPNFKE